MHLHGENGEMFSLPAGWTDLAPIDSFVVVADGRCAFTTDALVAVADLIDQLSTRRDGDDDDVKQTTP